MPPDAIREPASFRDPHGFVFTRGDVLYRQVNASAADDWGAFLDSGLYEELTGRDLLIRHTEEPISSAATSEAIAVLRPERVSFVSYPYEWTFGQLKDAALVTLDVQLAALERSMSLRDATPYNVQFLCGRPVLIDTLSFEAATPGAPWVAYRQFCEQFLAPLALMARRDPRLGSMLRPELDGIPLDLASRLLPAMSRLSPGLAAHIHLHARAQRAAGGGAAGDSRERRAGPRMSASRLRALVEHLRGVVSGLEVHPRGTTWADYAQRGDSYAPDALRAKERLVGEMLQEARGGRVWDIGANTGQFSQIAAEAGRDVIAIDGDWAAAELHYRAIKERREERVLPLVADIAAPTPALGWGLRERRSLLERADAQVVLALAVVHHIAIGRNVPLAAITELLARLAPETVAEFVPKTDPMVARMLAAREDIFPDYNLDGFLAALARTHEVVRQAALPGSERVLLHVRRRA